MHLPISKSVFLHSVNRKMLCYVKRLSVLTSMGLSGSDNQLSPLQACTQEYYFGTHSSNYSIPSMIAYQPKKVTKYHRANSSGSFYMIHTPSFSFVFCRKDTVYVKNWLKWKPLEISYVDKLILSRSTLMSVLMLSPRMNFKGIKVN